MNDRIRHCLRALRESPLDRGALRSRLDMSENELAWVLAELRSQDFQIDASEDMVHWQGGPARLDADAIAARLETEWIGRQVLVYRETGSTNDLALQLAGEDRQHGTVIFAESQRCGRGRHGRQWHSADRLGLWFSLALTLDRMPSPGLVSAWPAVALAEAASDLMHLDVQVKWPNDLVVDDRKVGGILVENRQLPSGQSALAIGIGWNIDHAEQDFPSDLRAAATSMHLLVPNQAWERNQIAAHFLNALDAHMPMLQRAPDRLLAIARQRSSILGRPVLLESHGEWREGLAKDFDNLYGLMIETSEGETLTVTHGEVRCRPATPVFSHVFP